MTETATEFQPRAYWHPEEGYFVLYPSDEGPQARHVVRVRDNQVVTLPEGAKELYEIYEISRKKFTGTGRGSSQFMAVEAANREVDKQMKEAGYVAEGKAAQHPFVQCTLPSGAKGWQVTVTKEGRKA